MVLRIESLAPTMRCYRYNRDCSDFMSDVRDMINCDFNDFRNDA